jgi:3-oxoacyl-[acyl-carrier-protein] synthase III
MSLKLYAATVALPPATETLARALDEGRLYGRTPEIEPEMRLPVATGSPVDLAAEAGRELLARTGFPAGEIDDLYYAWTYFQGAHFWSPAHALADRVGLSASNPIGLQQMCNGAGAALHLAHRCAAAGNRFAALIATGDVFRPPGFDRWSGDYGVLYGDAGTAVLAVSDGHPVPAGGPVTSLLTLRSGALPQLESMHRPVDDGADLDPSAGWPVDVQATKKRYLQEHGSQSLATAMQGLLHKLLAEVTADLRAGGRELTGDVYLPRLMDATLDSLYLPAVAKFTDRPLLRYGRVTGHLGAGDLIANLAEAQRQAGPEPRLDLIISAGAGFTISVAAVDTSPAGAR